jgi:hypothetical protein
MLNQFKAIKGIYGFMHSSGASYIGSSVDLWRRLFVQHKNAPFNKSVYKHRLFYNLVSQYG